MKKDMETLNEIAMNLLIVSDRMIIFTIIIFQIHEHGRKVFTSSSVFLDLLLQFKSFHFRGLLPPYLNATVHF